MILDPQCFLLEDVNNQVGSPGAGFLVLDTDDPAGYDRLLRRAAGPADTAS